MVSPFFTMLPKSTESVFSRPVTLKLSAACSSAASVPGAVAVRARARSAAGIRRTFLVGSADAGLFLGPAACGSALRHPASRDAMITGKRIVMVKFECRDVIVKLSAVIFNHNARIGVPEKSILDIY